MANSSKIDSIKVEEVKTDDSKMTTTTVFTEFGPIIKKDVERHVVVNGSKRRDAYTMYEGYIHPTDDKDALNGYFEIEKRVIYLSNPCKRETEVINCYVGYNRDGLGNITQINRRYDDEEKDPCKDVLKIFEERIEKVKSKLKNKDDLQK